MGKGVFNVEYAHPTMYIMVKSFKFYSQALEFIERCRQQGIKARML